MVLCAKCQKEMEYSQFEEDHLLGLVERCQEERLARRRCAIDAAVQSLDEYEARLRAERHVSRYHISAEEFLEMEKAQDYRCPICGQAYRWGDRGGHIDHDHRTGKIRGILCLCCNHGLGNFHDDPVLLRRAADFLEAHAPAAREEESDA